jgi:2'-5' RNA ligase
LAANPSSTLRLFLALWPDGPVRGALEQHAAAWAWPPAARRTPPERLHITLHFIGNVPADRPPALRDGLATSWEGCDLELDRAALWPGGIAVLEAAQVPAPLAQLHADLALRLRALDLPVDERPWRPHVTLARKAAGAAPPQAAQPVRWRAGSGYLLVRSLPGGGGYEPVASFG